MKRSSFPVAALLFGSGFCALVYQMTWMRQFRLIFGASTLATAAVLAIFMGGLGLGSALLGRRADNHPNPLGLYANLELLIALSAASSQLLLWIVGKLYIALGGSAAMGLTMATIVRLILSTLVLAIPTLLMGGTLPAAARAVETSDDAGRRKLAFLYGLNTLGAVTGALASTFFMLETFGNRKTLLIAVLLNLAVAMAARSMAHNAAKPESALEPIGEEPSTVPARFVVTAAAMTGFAFLLMELVWYRMLAPLLGGSTFTFGLILAMALLGIALGGTAYSLVSGSGSATAGAFALTCTLEAALMMLPFALGDRLAILANFLRVIGHAGFGGFVIGWTIVTAIVVLPSAIVAGVQFPLLIALLGRGRADVGAHVGRAYAWNTLGAIAGSLAGGFGFLPLFTATGCWQIASMLLVVTGVIAALYAMRASQRSAAIGSVAIAALVVLTGFETGPTAAWRHSSIGAGRADVPANPNDIRRWENKQRRRLVWEADGKESAIGLIDSDDTAFMVNGKSDGGAVADSSTQVMGGLVGAILHSNPRSAMVIGLGTGSTAGWLGAVPSMERVNVVELEPVVLRVANECTAVNHDVLRNPKVHVRIADAREVLLTSRDRYDIIFSEPSNPYRAGIASLFTLEFYNVVSARLNRGGIFLQWVQAYDIDAETVRTIYATIGSVFPQVTTWRTNENDLLIVATQEPVTFDVAQLRQRVESEPYRTALHATWRVESAEGVLAHFLAGDRVTRAASRGASLNTDDRTPIEFGFARSVGDTERFNMNQVTALAFAFGSHRPEGVIGTVDWQNVLLQRASETNLSNPNPAPEEKARHEFAALWNLGNFRGADASWKEHGRWQPVNSAENAMLAETLVIGGTENPMPFVQALRSRDPIEADALEGEAMFRSGDLPAATELLRRAFVAYRSYPWAKTAIMERALHFAVDLGRTNRSSGTILYDALEHPFAAGEFEQTRRTARLALARSLDGCGPRTIASLRAFEPWVPWDGPGLQVRADCYAKAGLRELAETARGQLGDFAENEPQRLVH
ncbi:MAG: spermidine synthase [Thermoanaerobaculia bacterium]|jgi:spermidine synthase|nr:spermidine synthase [Thermoanaerobaculia bacterium]